MLGVNDRIKSMQVSSIPFYGKARHTTTGWGLDNLNAVEERDRVRRFQILERSVLANKDPRETTCAPKAAA